MQMRIVPVLSLVTICLLLTGCTPAVRGIVGITLSEAGAPVALFAPCEGLVGGLRLYEIDAEGSLGDDVGRWDIEAGSAPEEFDFLASVSPPGDVSRFQLSAWAEHAAWPRPEVKNLSSTWFELADLAQLERGEVLYGDPKDFNISVTSNRAEFEALACPPE